MKVRRHSASILSRCRGYQALEFALQMRLVGKASIEGNFGDAVPAPKAGTAILNTVVELVGVRRQTVVLLESADEIGGR